MKQQFVLTHTIRQNEIPALLDSAVMNNSSVKMLCLARPNVFVKT